MAKSARSRKALPLHSPTPEKKADARDTKEFADDDMTEIMERAHEAYRKEEHNITAAYEDLEFLAGEGMQWTPDAKRRRRDRPMLEINQMPKFVRQVTGDFRQSRPGIKIIPLDGRATKEVGELMAGMCRYIENRSEGRAAYNVAGDQMAGCGVGALRVLREFAEETTFNQELRIVQVEDGISVLWDTDAILPTREDAMWCFVPVDLSVRKFKAKYPDVPYADFNAYDQRYTSYWTGQDTVRVAEYFEKRPIKRTLALHEDGAIEDLTDADEATVAAAEDNGARVEERDGFKVWRSLVTLGHVLEKAKPWPGRYIPIVPMIGEEVRIGRKTIRRGVVRLMKDSQRRYNYNVSQQVEVMALAPKAPWLGTKKNFEDTLDEWSTANEENHPFLEYTPDPLNGGREPSRTAPAMSSVGLAQDIQLCVNEMQEVTGIYRSSLGAKSNETSGIAIKERDQQTDTGNTTYLDNFSLSIRHVWKIVVDMIPSTYDTERMVMILGEDGEAETHTINKAVMSSNVPDEAEEPEDVGTDDEPLAAAPEAEAAEEADEPGPDDNDFAGEDVENAADEGAGVDQDPDGTEEESQGPPRDPNATYINDVTIGSYGVIFANGPSFATKQDEASEGMGELIKGAPEIAPLILDLYAKQQQWPMAGEIAKRIEVMLPPPIQAMIAKEKAEKEASQKGLPPPGGPPGMGMPPMGMPGPGMPPGAPGAPPMQPPGPTPAEMAAQQADVAKAQSSAQVAAMAVEIKKIELAMAQLEHGKASDTSGGPAVQGLVEEMAHLHGMVAEIISAMGLGAQIPDTAAADEAARAAPNVGQVGQIPGQPLDNGAEPQMGAEVAGAARELAHGVRTAARAPKTIDMGDGRSASIAPSDDEGMSPGIFEEEPAPSGNGFHEVAAALRELSTSIMTAARTPKTVTLPDGKTASIKAVAL